MQQLRTRIAGTGASNILGCGYINNQEYFKEFIEGKRDFTDPDLIEFAEYGKGAEAPLVELFALDFPEYIVTPNTELVISKEYEFMVGIPDAYIIDFLGNKGILEIKTRTAFSKAQFNDVVYDFIERYYWQIIHYLLIDKDAEYAICKMQIKKSWCKDVFTKYYSWTRNEVQKDIDFLEREEILFMDCVNKKIQPPLRLPNI